MGDDTTAAILTGEQRNFVTGDRDDLSDAAARAYRSRIRRRIAAAVEDMKILVENSDEGRIDLTQPLDEDSPMWALPALLFLWADDNKVPTVLDTRPEEETPQEKMDRRTQRFGLEAERGVEAALEFDSPGRLINGVESETSVDVGPELDAAEDRDIAALPRRYIDQLFRAGELDKERYAEVIEERFDRVEQGDLDPRPPVGSVPNNIDDLEDYLDYAVREREKQADE